MLEDLKLLPGYDGFIFLADAARNPPRLKPHTHIELELNLVVRGTITYVVDGRRQSFGRGTLLWLYPAQVHQLVERTPDSQNYVAVFRPELIARSCQGTRYAGLRRVDVPGEGVLQAVLMPEDFDLVRRTMDGLTAGAPDPDLVNREAGFGLNVNFRYEHADPDGLNAGLHHLLLLCWRCQQAGRAGTGRAVPLHPTVSRALALLGDEECDGGLTRLARRCEVSPAYLSRVFRRQVGVSLTRYRNSTRLARFWENGRGGRAQTLVERVYAAGFGSYAQFHKVFREAYGCGPRAWLQARDGETTPTTRRKS
jgi:methylphosphotriester-DNA--protein-cysteine methyltransferase